MQKKKILLFGILLAIFSMLFTGSVAAYIIEPPPGGNPSMKYGFFFWTSDIGTQSMIDGYENTLRSKGYITYDYKDASIYSVFNTIDSFEDYNDILFFYFCGHGYYQNGKSYYWYTPYSTISSYMMRLEFNDFESSDVAILVDACHAGDFVDRFSDKNGYLVMTSSDESHTALYNKITKEPCFSWSFWLDLACWPQHTALDAFYNARLFWWYFYPQIGDNADYNFF